MYSMFEILVPLFLAALVVVLYRLTLAVERLNKTNTKPEKEAYRVVVEEGGITEEELPVGLYRANEQDAAQYMFDKVRELREAKQDRHYDWRIDDESEA